MTKSNHINPKINHPKSFNLTLKSSNLRFENEGKLNRSLYGLSNHKTEASEMDEIYNEHEPSRKRARF